MNNYKWKVIQMKKEEGTDTNMNIEAIKEKKFNCIAKIAISNKSKVSILKELARKRKLSINDFLLISQDFFSKITTDVYKFLSPIPYKHKRKQTRSHLKNHQ
jgi:lipoate-protein ligase A